MLSQASGYAISAMGHIAGIGGKPVLISEISTAADIPAPYLGKIINQLSKRGLVNTQRGVGGGVTLARPAIEITLHDVCKALDDPAVLSNCMLGSAECSDSRACPAHKFWTAHRSKLHAFLTATNVADIAAFEARRRWKHELDSNFPSSGPHVHPTSPSGTVER